MLKVSLIHSYILTTIPHSPKALLSTLAKYHFEYCYTHNCTKVSFFPFVWAIRRSRWLWVESVGIVTLGIRRLFFYVGNTVLLDQRASTFSNPKIARISVFFYHTKFKNPSYVDVPCHTSEGTYNRWPRG